MLAAAGDDANVALAAFERANHGAGYAFFIEGLGLFFLGAQLDHGRACARDIGGARQLRLLEHVDVLDMHFGRKIGIAVQQILARLHAAGLVEILDGHVLLQVADHLLGLIGKREPLVGGCVVRLVVAVREIIRDHYHGQDHQDIDGRRTRRTWFVLL